MGTHSILLYLHLSTISTTITMSNEVSATNVSQSLKEELKSPVVKAVDEVKEVSKNGASENGAGDAPAPQNGEEVKEESKVEETKEVAPATEEAKEEAPVVEESNGDAAVEVEQKEEQANEEVAEEKEGAEKRPAEEAVEGGTEAKKAKIEEPATEVKKVEEVEQKEETPVASA